MHLILKTLIDFVEAQKSKNWSGSFFSIFVSNLGGGANLSHQNFGYETDYEGSFSPTYLLLRLTIIWNLRLSKSARKLSHVLNQSNWLVYQLGILWAKLARHSPFCIKKWGREGRKSSPRLWTEIAKNRFHFEYQNVTIASESIYCLWCFHFYTFFNDFFGQKTDFQISILWWYPKTPVGVRKSD